MNLELKHLAPYLPYKINPLKIKYFDGIYTLDGLTGAWNVDIRQAMRVTRNVHIETVIPILRPLKEAIIPYDRLPFDEDGNKEPNDLFIDDSGKVAMDFQAGGATISWPIVNMQEYLEGLFKDMFDVFGLIDAGLAIDINTL